MTLAYAVPPVLAVALGFIGIMQISEAGVVGTSAIETAAPGPDSPSNTTVAEALERVARDNDATVVRVVADRTAPTTRRTALVTSAPSSDGSRWLRDGYADFSGSMTTTVRPMSALDRFDPTGPYEVLGDDQARRATVDALTGAGYDVTSEAKSLPERLGIVAGLDGTWGLIGALILGSVALCFIGTIGSPRRTAVRRLHGHGTVSVLVAELSAARSTAIVAVVGLPALALVMWCTNRLASAAALGTAVGVFCALLLPPVVVAHVIGVVVACRRPITPDLRGARPSGGLLFFTQAARVPALLLLVSAVVDLTGAVAVARSGSSERDLEAAGATVQLWVTPDPRPGVDTQAYWDRIGRFTAAALDDRRALLSAGVEVSSGRGNDTMPALFVSPGYLDLHDVRAADGSRIRADDDRISVWIPAGSDVPRDAFLRALSDWELRNAPDRVRHDVRSGRLAPQDVYTYPGDSTSRSWLRDAPLIVVPRPAAVFTDDQLGSWLSTGDVVFTSEESAEHSLAGSDVEHEISAVVAVGQIAAEEARQASIAANIAAASVGSSLIVAIVLGILSVLADRRRHGRALFARAAAGVPSISANRSLIVVEGVLTASAVVIVANTWWHQRPGGDGVNSALDPVVQASGLAAALSIVSLAIVTGIDIVVIAWSARNVTRNRGNVS